MTPKQIALIRSSYERVAPLSGAIGLSVYENLFRFHPELQELFVAEIEPQADQLMTMLATVIQVLDRPAQLHPMFFALGQRHALYGVRDEHYDIVGGALLTALGSRLGPAFAPDIEAAWTALYAEIATSMIAGARGHAQAS